MSVVFRVSKYFTNAVFFIEKCCIQENFRMILLFDSYWHKINSFLLFYRFYLNSNFDCVVFNINVIKKLFLGILKDLN